MDKASFGLGQGVKVDANPVRVSGQQPTAPAFVPYASHIADGGLARVSELWHRLPADVRETVVRIAEVWAAKPKADDEG